MVHQFLQSSADDACVIALERIVTTPLAHLRHYHPVHAEGDNSRDTGKSDEQIEARVGEPLLLLELLVHELGVLLELLLELGGHELIELDGHQLLVLLDLGVSQRLSVHLGLKMFPDLIGKIIRATHFAVDWTVIRLVLYMKSLSFMSHTT